MIFRSSVALLLCVLSANALAETESFVFYRQDTQIGRLVVEVNGNAAKIDFDVKDNGRGPTVAETLTLDAQGLPGDWKITGTQTFGGKIDEAFRRRGFELERLGRPWQREGGFEALHRAERKSVGFAALRTGDPQIRGSARCAAGRYARADQG